MILYPSTAVASTPQSVARSAHAPSSNHGQQSDNTSFLRLANAPPAAGEPQPVNASSELRAKLRHWYLGAPGTLLGAALGLLVGYILTRDGIKAPLKELDFNYGKMVEKSLLQPGFLFLRAVSCIMFPLTIANLVVVSAEITMTKRRWMRMGWRVVLLSCLASAIVVGTGLVVGIRFSGYFEGRKFGFRTAPMLVSCPYNPTTPNASTTTTQYLQVNATTKELYCGPALDPALQKLAFALNDTTKRWTPATVSQFFDYGTAVNEIKTVLFRTQSTTFILASNSNLIQLVVLAFAAGVGIGVVDRDAKTNKVFQVMRELALVFETMTNWITSLAPLALVSLVAGPIYTGTHNAFDGIADNAIIDLLWYALAFTIVAAAHGLVVLPLLLAVCTRTDPLKLLWHMKHAFVYTFSISSTRQSLPVVRSAYHRAVGQSQPATTFLLHVGASLNKGGGALYICMSLLWLFYNAGLVDFFTPTKIGLTAAISTLGAYAVAPVRNGGVAAVIVAYAMLTGMLTPYAFNFLFLVECVVDPIATVLNAWTNVVVTRIVERLDPKVRRGSHVERSDAATC
ncbi:Aste57867_17973 [Aphanomyces stellatus]|uniref:Amino acid transporter n=1 Tax=Aphanomyces stellatus TaxID=120398 RepID=A0A485LAI4_9STRA|nr:hypothetical protein As57867_017911 [Aphanomyces stellatus]VFT94713.1 Aste57867_17973 [Aphanomyces stellatus]